MLQGEVRRVLRTGVIVCVRLEGTMELVTKARMLCLPRPNDSLFTYADGVEVEYKVEGIRFDLYHKNTANPTGYVGGVAQYGTYEQADIADVAPIVIVSLVP